MKGLRFIVRSLIIFSLALGLLIAVGLAMTAKKRRESSLLQNARDIEVMLFTYAEDHHGRYPDGKTSTEVFQKLLDGGYVFDSDGIKANAKIFYVAMPGKTPATSSHLTSANVGWDITTPTTDFGSAKLPILFLTGYRLDYRPGGKATPRPWPVRSWRDWMTNTDYPRGFIVISYCNDSRYVLEAGPDGSIPNATPKDFKSNGLPYHQLTPDDSAP